MEAGHSVQGTHARVNACLRLQRAWSNRSAEGYLSYLSQRPMMIQTPASLGVLLLNQLKKSVWGRVPRLTVGSIKVVCPAAEREDIALLMVEWQQNVPAAWCRCAGGSASLLTCWLRKSEWECVLCNGGVYTNVKQNCTPGFSGLCGVHGDWSPTLKTRAVECCVSLVIK